MSIFDLLAQRLPHENLSWTGEGLQAAVLVAITDEPEPQVILGRRALHLRLHPGEIAFPGGKREPEDDSPWTTALREAHEEIGLQSHLVQPLGELPTLVTRTQFEVHPCVAKIPPIFDMIVDPGELASVFLTPLAVLADQKFYRLEKMAGERGDIMVPHYQINDDNIWGVTAAVLVQVVNLAMDANLDLEPNGKTT